MTVKIAILKTGEQIISDISEGFVGEKMVCYILKNPCSVFINGSFDVKDTDRNKNNKMSVSLYPWPILTTDTVIQLPMDAVTTIVNPNLELKEMYETQVLTYGDGDNQDSGDEVGSSSDKSD